MRELKEISFTFKSITTSKCRDETRENFELNPKKTKLNAKTPDRIRSMMASIGAEPGRAARDVMNVS